MAKLWEISAYLLHGLWEYVRGRRGLRKVGFWRLPQQKEYE